MLIVGLFLSSAAYAASINCTSGQLAAAHAAEGAREQLSNGGYGFCVPTECLSGFNLNEAKKKCEPPPVASWLSTNNQEILEAEIVMTFRGQLSSAAPEALDLLLSPMSPDAQVGVDFDLLTPQMHFDKGSSVSSPVQVQIHRMNTYLDRTVNLTIQSSGKVLAFKINGSVQSPLQSVTLSSPTVTAGETANVQVIFTEPVSKLFPAKLKLQVGMSVIQALLPARAKLIEIPVPTTEAQAGQSLAMVLVGYAGASGNVTVQSAQSEEPEAGQTVVLGTQADPEVTGIEPITILPPSAGRIRVMDPEQENGGLVGYVYAGSTSMVYSPYMSGLSFYSENLDGSENYDIFYWTNSNNLGVIEGPRSLEYNRDAVDLAGATVSEVLNGDPNPSSYEYAENYIYCFDNQWYWDEMSFMCDPYHEERLMCQDNPDALWDDSSNTCDLYYYPRTMCESSDGVIWDEGSNSCIPSEEEE